MKTYRFLIAVLLSPPLSALAHTLTTLILEETTTFNFLDFLTATVMLAFITAPLSYGATIIIGIPVIYLLKRYGYLKPWLLLSIVFFIGAVIPMIHAVHNKLDIAFTLYTFSPRFGFYALIIAVGIWYISGITSHPSGRKARHLA